MLRLLAYTYCVEFTVFKLQSYSDLENLQNPLGNLEHDRRIHAQLHGSAALVQVQRVCARHQRDAQAHGRGLHEANGARERMGTRLVLFKAHFDKGSIKSF